MSTFLRSAQTLARQYLDRRALMLVYHSISDATVDPFETRVAPANFAEHLDVLRRHCTPLSVSDMLTRMHEGRLPVRSIAITFDDGYADNAVVALPLLEQYDMPSTMFVISDFIDADAENWWDAILSVLLRPGELRADIDFRLDGTQQRFHLGESAQFSAADAARWAGWLTWDTVAPTRRHELVRMLGERLPYATISERDHFLQALRDAIVSDSPRTVVRRGVTSDELRALGANPLVEVGAHSVSHRSLASLTTADQLHEVTASRARIREYSGQQVRSFAYPFGKAGHVTSETIRAVQEAGFTSACMNISGHVTAQSDPYRLPRFHVGNWDGEEFSDWLNRWLREAYAD